MECWTTGGMVNLREGSIGSTDLPVNGLSTGTSLANNGTGVPDVIDNNEPSNPLWKVAIDVIRKNVVLPSDGLVAKGSHLGIVGPEKQMDEVGTDRKRDESLTGAKEVGPL